MKSKGFTLIELLAVIVILAIIALIATPIVLNIIKDSKDSSTLQSAEFYLGTVETAITKQIMDDSTFKPSSCNIQTDGNLKCDGIDVKVEIKGEVPTRGTITLENGKIKNSELVLNNKTMIKDNDTWLYAGLYDADGNLIVSWDKLVNDYNINIDKNYADNDQSSPGIILSTNEYLSKGVKLVIDSSVANVGTNALKKCTSLKEIIIPNSVTSIGGAAFLGCSSLEKITIPNSVTSIGGSAFSGCSNLKEIMIPNGVTSINYATFSNCTGLEKASLPNSVTSIGQSAFEGCTNLKEMIIPNSVTSIGDWAFQYCTSLKEITIPDSVVKIGNGAFNDMRLNAINYTGTPEQWNSITFGSSIASWLINYNYVIPEN